MMASTAAHGRERRGARVARAPWFAEARREERCPPWTTGYPKVSPSNSARSVATSCGPCCSVIAIALVGIPFGLLLHQVTTDGPLTALDDSAARWLNERFHGEDGVITLLDVVSFLGKPIFLLFAIGIPGAVDLHARRPEARRSSSPSPASAAASSTRS